MAVGTIAACRPIGIIELIDRGEIDNKLIAVPVCCKEYEKIQDIKDLPPDFEKAYREFYRLVGVQKNKSMEIKGFFGKDRAIEELNKARLSCDNLKENEQGGKIGKI